MHRQYAQGTQLGCDVQVVALHGMAVNILWRSAPGPRRAVAEAETLLQERAGGKENSTVEVV